MDPDAFSSPLARAAALPERSHDDPRMTRIHLRRELIADGMSDKEIAAALAGGALHRPRYGTYVDAADWQVCDEVGRSVIRTRSAVRRANSEVVVSHLSALAEWDVPIWDLAMDRVHLTRTDGRAGRREAGIVQHLGNLRPGDVMTRHGMQVTTPTRTALDCLGLVDTEHGVTIVGDLLHRGLTSAELLEEGRAHMLRWPGSLRHRLVTRIADGRCESVGEHRTLFLCRQHQVPTPTPQYEVHDPDGTRWRLDFAWPSYGLWMEFDGLQKYAGLLRPGEAAADALVREKRREDRIRELTGWRCVRLVWADLYRPRRTIERIRRALEQGGWAVSA